MDWNMKAIKIGMILLALAAIACKPDPSKDYTQFYQFEMLIDLLPYFTPGETVYVYSCNVVPEKCYNLYRDTRLLNQATRSCYQSELLEAHCPAESSVGACVQAAINYLGVLETVYYSPSRTTDSAREICPSSTTDNSSQYFLDTYTIKNVWPR